MLAVHKPTLIMYSNKIVYIGCDDPTLDLFENQYPLSEGMCYNSYLLNGDKVAVMDSVDKRTVNQWLTNLANALQGRSPSYLIIQHMESDHSGAIDAFLKKYPDCSVVGSRAALQYMQQFGFETCNTLCIQHGDSLDIGGLTLHFASAPMVHWPEVMMTYIPEEKTLFSADAFGSFGIYHAHPDNWTDEARRYYVNICGKYGTQVNVAMKKVQGFDIQTIAPLHGCILDGMQLQEAWRLYETWSNYRPECTGVLIAHASIHGHTAEVAARIANHLRDRNVEVSVLDLCRIDASEAISQAFKYDKIVLCASSYDTGVFPPMYMFLYKLCNKNYQSRRVALVENGTWAPTAGKTMRTLLESMTDIEIISPMLTIRSAWKEEYHATLNELLTELM